MEKLIIAFPVEQTPRYLAFESVPSATNENSSFPASNLLTYDPTQVFKTTTSSTVITWDLLSARLFNVISLLHSNASHRATLVVETSANGISWTTRYNGMFWASLSSDPGPGPYVEQNDPRQFGLERQCSFYLNELGMTARFVRLTVADSLNSTLSFGRLFVGRHFTPQRGYQYGSSFTFNDTGQKDRTDRGATVLDEGRSIVGASIKLEFLTKEEMFGWLYDLNFWRKQTKEVLVCLDADDIPNRIKKTLYCTLGDGRQVVADAFNAYSQTLNVESL